MVRDGRAVIHSVIKRKVTITGYKLDDPRQCLQRWSTVVSCACVTLHVFFNFFGGFLCYFLCH